MTKEKNTVKIKDNFEITISKDELSSLQPARFEGEIIVIENVEEVADAVSELKKEELIGFDTETKPAFQKGRINRVALLQLATPSKSYLFRLSKIGLPDELKALLENERQLKVGLSIKDDFHSLAKISLLKPQGFIDLQEYVKQFGITDCSLTKIHAIIFGQRISKSQQLTNWEAISLTQRQQEYAALDALACVNIYKTLKNGEFNPELSPYRKIKEQEDINEKN